ncbi:MAG: DUF2281 domain-containing protein [Treponema sp.]|jgi:hypothetical protein|nr:DUF2281 domain-containing protein [Treponema sp.]
MIEHVQLLQEIDKLPPKYYGEVFDFVEYLRCKTQNDSDTFGTNTFGTNEDAYKAMAADTEREQEAREWCNAYFGPAYTYP